MGVSKTIAMSFFGSTILLVTAVCIQYFFVMERWAFVKSLNKGTWSASDFTIHPESSMSITYYDVDKLGEVLTKWPHGQFRLYRLRNNDKYEFDAQKMLDSKVVVRKLDYDCNNTECSSKSVLKLNCVFDLKAMNGKESLVEAPFLLTTEGKGYTASFANFTNKDTIQNLWDFLKLPFSPKGAKSFEHAFISNLKEPMITATFHANPITDSMAIQYEGRKTWLFLPPTTYLSLMRSTFAGSTILPKQAPAPNTRPDVHIYTSEPGDVLFFPESWGHAVYTYKGPNVMFNFRNLYLGNFLRQPITWITSLVEHLVNERMNTRIQRNEEIRMIQKIVPQKAENARVQDMYAEMCADGKKTGFDQQMLDIMDAEVARVTLMAA
jgi:hypothetical protein